MSIKDKFFIIIVIGLIAFMPLLLFIGMIQQETMESNSIRKYDVYEKDYYYE